MKVSYILPLAAAANAFVLPSEQVLREAQIEDNHRNSWYDEALSVKDRLVGSSKEVFEKYYDEISEVSKDAWSKISEDSKNAFDDAWEAASETKDTVNEKVKDTTSGVKSWFNSEVDDLYNAFDDHHDHPHHPHHPPHHEINQTVYQLISSSKYTTKLTKLINEFDDLVEALNSTKSNFTVIAPSDDAFAKIPDDAPEPSKEQLKKFLQYHVIDGLYPARRVLASHTAPTLLKGEHLGPEPEPQRVTFRLGLNGLSVNWISRVRIANIEGTNGYIHGVDTPLFPPIGVIEEIDLFPTAFSTLELGLGKTGLLEKLNDTNHPGGTAFFPNNGAFQKLGPRINAFLFSKAGEKYLKALLEYHVVPANTLYSDAFYKARETEVEPEDGHNGYFHVELPTFLKDRTLGVDIARYGPFIEIKVNAFARVAVKDVPAEDGVIQVMGDVIIPPKKLNGQDELSYWQGEEMSVEEFKERFDPLIDHKTDL